MRRDTWVSLFVVLVVVLIAVLAWHAAHRHPRSVTRTETTVLVAPPATPLRDSGPKNNAKRGSSTTAQSSQSRATAQPTAQPQNRSLPVKNHQTPKTTPTPRPPSQGSPQPAQPSPAPSPQPSQPPPVIGVTVPGLPGSVCLRPAATVNCP